MKFQNIVCLNVSGYSIIYCFFKYLLITHYVQDLVQKIKIAEIINTTKLALHSINYYKTQWYKIALQTSTKGQNAKMSTLVCQELVNKHRVYQITCQWSFFYKENFLTRVFLKKRLELSDKYSVLQPFIIALRSFETKYPMNQFHELEAFNSELQTQSWCPSFRRVKRKQ